MKEACDVVLVLRRSHFIRRSLSGTVDVCEDGILMRVSLGC